MRLRKQTRLGMLMQEVVRKLKPQQEQNLRLKKLLAELSLDAGAFVSLRPHVSS